MVETVACCGALSGNTYCDEAIIIKRVSEEYSKIRMFDGVKC